MKFDMDDTQEKSEVKANAEVSSSLKINPSGFSTGSLDHKSPGIIRKIIHTRTELNIYPNGQIYLGKQQQWMEGAVYTSRKKVKKVVKTKKVALKQKEEY